MSPKNKNRQPTNQLNNKNDEWTMNEPLNLSFLPIQSAFQLDMYMTIYTKFKSCIFNNQVKSVWKANPSF